MSLIKYYIREVLQEAINFEDNQKIENAIQIFTQNLKSEGLDLGTLDFDARAIIRMRDSDNISNINRNFGIQPIRDAFNRFRLGLGFNPFGELHIGNNYKILEAYCQRVDGLYRSKHRNSEIEICNHIARGAYAIKSAADDSGLKILGSGVFRVALQLPQIPDVIIKIALSQAGRDDNLNEINFSLGQGAAAVSHKQNFSNVYAHSKDGSWMVVDKEIIFADAFDTMPEVIDNLMNNQFKNTMKLLDRLGILQLCKSSGKPVNNVFAEYVYHMFNFGNKSLSQINKSYIEKININDSFFKRVINDLKSAIGLSTYVKTSDYIKMSDDYFKSRFCDFLIGVLKPFDRVSANVQKADETIEKMISDISAVDFRRFSKELGTLFDQSMTTGVSDMHLGNIGVKKGQDGNYRLIFTDIDSGTYSL